MGLASYEIVGGAGEWRVSHDGKAKGGTIKPKRHLKRLSPLFLALRQGHEVRIIAPGSGTATGAANRG